MMRLHIILLTLLIIFTIRFDNMSLAGNKIMDVSGSWQINLDLQVQENGLMSEISRLESLPFDLRIEQNDTMIDVLPEYYLKGGFRGKGYVEGNLIYFTGSSFEETLFTERKVSMKIFNLILECSGFISPEEDYITGQVRGTIIVAKSNRHVPCSIKDGTFTMVKAGRK
ncbi:MAG: hypothetical protein ABRQ38_00800 [Candidatus Eremiobacterota bacterium]